MREKVLILTLICIMFSTNAMAVVVFHAVDNGDGTVTIGYTSDGDALRGVALLLTCTGTVQIEGYVAGSADAAYNCFIDYAYSNDPYNLGDGHPLADPAGPGVCTLPAAEISICMGVLDETGNQGTGPAVADPLIQLSVSGIGTIEITADTLRGPSSGVVGDGEIPSNLSDGGMIIIEGCSPCVCMAYTNPDYETWVSLGMPECWCYEKQCHGDVDGLMQFGVLSPMTWRFSLVPMVSQRFRRAAFVRTLTIKCSLGYLEFILMIWWHLSLITASLRLHLVRDPVQERTRVLCLIRSFTSGWNHSAL